MLTKTQLLKLPKRKWDDTSNKYDFILLVPAGTKHDSGYMHIAIIGGTYNEMSQPDNMEICGYPDDIQCHFPMYKINEAIEMPSVRMDCYYPEGILRYHGRGKFTVGVAISSMEIYFTPKNKQT